ncbi:hypothetical protein OSB04_008889 [Centaurea solstitialis]|uniref:CCHC-type domain-containing protein n=1 Tax=Centaurea solstitialis TaxID=347529 RepID=A0AA38TMR7_9ASTR|nr:hypothetical protein OSB04_008889 [Centaurea solstitialis]
MASTVTSTNNLSLRSILEKDKLTGSNFLDWERNLMIVLRHERKWYVLEEPLGEAPPANAPAAARNAHKKHSDDLLDVACLMLATMSPDLQTGLINTNAYDMIRQLRDMFQTQARTERYDATKAFNECKMVKGTSLATDTILNSLSEDYRPFVVNYNMNNMEKTIAELHSMLKTAELNMGNKNKTKDVLMVKDGGVKKKNGQASTSKGKGPVQAIQSAPKKGKGKGKGKKVKPNKARTENRCFICNEIGHWRQNCPKRHEAVEPVNLRRRPPESVAGDYRKPLSETVGDPEPVKQKRDGIFINQSKYVATMLQKFGMNDAKPTSTPMETHKHLTADVEGEEVDVHQYRSMIGSLMYLIASRPDIMFAVYSDYGGANLDRKSTSGGCQFLGGRLVSWQCKKQTTVSQSTTEAEYIAASQCCSQVLWIQNQIQDYGLSFLQTPIYIDNNSAISIVNNPVKHSKTKHIEIKYHLIRDCNEKKLIQVQKVHTDDQYADLFTKAFDVGRFIFLVTSVGMMNSE